MPGDSPRYSASFLLLIFTAGLLVGSIFSCYFAMQQVEELRRGLAVVESRLSALWGSQHMSMQNVTIYQNLTSLADLYNEVKASVVLITVQSDEGFRQGSGFIYNFTGEMVIVTNYHVIHKAVKVSVTFWDGEAFKAEVLGKDPYADLAVLSAADVPPEKFKPLKAVSSATLKVGDPVIAIGNPYGLVGSMTTGIVSALGRTITEEYTGGFAIANVIQTSAPINPGNSGGPLLNYKGEVVGITTAIVSDSQGLGFAIPSDTLLKELHALITTGTYHGHAYLGIEGRDVDYDTAEKMNLPITYGWLVINVKPDGPSHGNLQANDVIIALNNTRIRNGDDLASYLERCALPGDTLKITLLRKINSSWNTVHVIVVLGERPPPPI